MSHEITPGQIYRDTHGDSRPLLNQRLVRILSREPDGRWLAETLTNPAGQPVKPRKSRLKETTIMANYELRKAGTP